MSRSIFQKFAASTLLSMGLSSAAIAAEVEFLSAFDISMSRYGMTWSTESYQVVVDNVASNKKVYIHRQLEGGEWVDIPMYFDGKAGQNKEIWRVSTDGEGLGEQFVVKMVADGVEYWDNNNGQNYDLSYGYTIGNTNEVVVSGVGTSESPEEGMLQVYVPIVLDNLGYDKQVEVVYTNDNWATATVVPAQFDGNRPIVGYGSYPNPSNSGAERWTANFDIDPSTKHQFFVKYTVDGVSYYANNYGLNYTINFDSNFESMYVRNSLGWDNGRQMTLIDDNLWAFNFGSNGGEIDYKFDVYNDWTVNFGDNEMDGIADPAGANIALPIERGSYRIYFDDSTNVYSVSEHGLN